MVFTSKSNLICLSQHTFAARAQNFIRHFQIQIWMLLFAEVGGSYFQHTSIIFAAVSLYPVSSRVWRFIASSAPTLLIWWFTRWTTCKQHVRRCGHHVDLPVEIAYIGIQYPHFFIVLILLGANHGGSRRRQQQSLYLLTHLSHAHLPRLYNFLGI